MMVSPCVCLCVTVDEDSHSAPRLPQVLLSRARKGHHCPCRAPPDLRRFLKADGKVRQNLQRINCAPPMCPFGKTAPAPRMRRDRSLALSTLK